jgi:hypothetical protein
MSAVMTPLAALLLAAASARVESVSLTPMDSRLAVRVLISGAPGRVTVHQEGDVARVSILDAELGLRFAGGRRFSWTPSGELDPALLAATPARLDRLEIVTDGGEVSIILHVRPGVRLDVRRDPAGLLVTFRSAAAAGRDNAERAATAPPASAAPGATDTAELAKGLFPSAPAEDQAAGPGSVAELYPRLFPAGAPEAAPETTEAPASVVETGPDGGVAVGPFRLRAAVEARYVNADTFLESQAEPTRDDYLEVQPRLAAAAPVSYGRFTLDYAPVFRALAAYSDVNRSSQSLGAELELPIGASVTLRARDRFRSGVLDTRVVDPGGEYFFGLGHFRRNDGDVGLRVMVAPRLSVELGGALGTLAFQEPSAFFDYGTRSASAGFGYEVTPSLRAIASYVYDAVPRPDERPEAESTAHSGRLTLTGDILPLLTGELSVGYRNQSTPRAAAGGTSYSGLTLSAALLRQLGHDSSLGLLASRSTPVSAYERNGFYVSSGVQGTLQVPLPAQVQARGGLGYQWNDYRTVASEIGRPREDRILGWYAGLRRPVRRNLFLSGAYRSEHRRSNVDAFDTQASGFYFQLEWDLFGTPPR